MFKDVPECSGMFRNVPCSAFYRRPQGFVQEKIIWNHLWEHRFSVPDPRVFPPPGAHFMTGSHSQPSKNQNIVAINISFLKPHRDSRILQSRAAKKTWQIMWRKRIFKWQPSKLLWIWIFGSVIKVRTTEINYYLSRLLWSCLKPQAGFAEREKKLYCASIALVDGCIACICCWLLVIYILDVG